MTEKMWCIVDAAGEILLWTIRRTPGDAIEAEIGCIYLNGEDARMTWERWSRQQGYRTARCTVTTEE